jgi:hypothetical protein
MIVRLIALTSFVLLAFAAGWLFRHFQPPARYAMADAKWELADALPDWLPGRRACVIADEQERRVFELAVSSLELASGDGSPGFLQLGAKRQLAAGVYRRDGKESIPVFFPEDIYDRASNSVSLQKEIKYRLVDYELKLFARLPKRNPNIVKAVGQSAFNNTPQESDLFRSRDIRPYARTVLAAFGKEATDFSAIAYQQMSAADSLGTGAAQVAAASGHPDALPRIRKMMEDLIASVPADKALPYAVRNRLYELSYAIYFSGEGAKEYAAPIKAIMTRTVQSWAPPFGMVEIRPKRMCRLLEHIEGPAAIQGYDFCL